MATAKKSGISAGIALLVLVLAYLIFGRSKASASTSSAGIVGSAVNANPVVGGLAKAASAGQSVASVLGYTPDIARGEDEGYTTDVKIADDTNYPPDQGANFDPSIVSVDPSLLVSQ